MDRSLKAGHQQQAPFRVGAAQIDPVPGDLAGNVAKHVEFIKKARQEGVELLVFPELSLTGYHVGARTLDLAIARDDPWLQELAEEAGEMTVVAGFIEEGMAAQFHNSAIALRAGKIRFVHRKLNLATYGHLEEDKYFAEGRYVDVFSHRSPWHIALLICADAWNPGLVHLAALSGATILVTPVASSREALGGRFSNPEGWRLVLSFYSLVYGMPAIMSNLCGGEEGTHYWGGSCILDARGNMLTQADDQEGLLVADLDYETLREARFELPTVRDSNLDLIHREIERLANRIGVPRGVRSDG